MAISKIESAENFIRNYSIVRNGVTFGLSLFGSMGVLTISTGSLSQAVPASGTLVELTDFSNDLKGKAFYRSFQGVYTTSPQNRFDCVSGSNRVIAVGGLDANFSPRGTVSVVII